MRKFIILTCLSLSALIFLDSVNAGHALVMFYLAGVIPGTNFSMSASRMLETFSLLIGFTVSRIVINIARQSTRRSERHSRPTAAILAV